MDQTRTDTLMDTEQSIYAKLQFIPADICFSSTPTAPPSQGYGLLTFSQIQMDVPEKIFKKKYLHKPIIRK